MVRILHVRQVPWTAPDMPRNGAQRKSIRAHKKEIRAEVKTMKAAKAPLDIWEAAPVPVADVEDFVAVAAVVPGIFPAEFGPVGNNW